MITYATGEAGVPRGIPTRAIHQRQLDEDMLRLQRAASASHRRGQQLEAFRTTAATSIALAGITVTLAGHGRQAMSIIGFAWFLVSAALLRSVAGSTARQGAVLQEMFDAALFYLPWRPTVAGNPIPEPDISRLARKIKAGSVRGLRITTGWYDPTDGVHHPLDVLVAQEQNLSWDARLRRRYSYWVLAIGVLWGLLGVLVGMIIADATITEVLLSFFVPSLAAYQLGFDIWHGQRRVAKEREGLSGAVSTELRSARPGPVSEAEQNRLRDVARSIQDGVFRTRLDVTRVPEWYYRRHRSKDERDFADTAEGHRRRLAMTAP